MRAVIWDLDDTLVDTWQTMLMPAIDRAADAMAAALGTQDPLPLARVWRSLLASGQTGSADDMCRLVVETMGVALCDEAAISRGVTAFETHDIPLKLPLLPGASCSLALVAAAGRPQYLVTSGPVSTQHRKVLHSGIAGYFDQVVYVDSQDTEGKLRSFQTILRTLACRSESIVCIGDRPDREIRFANALGMKSVRIVYGEHAHRFEASGELPTVRTNSHAGVCSFLMAQLRTGEDD